jgi:hypothetical protein
MMRAYRMNSVKIADFPSEFDVREFFRLHPKLDKFGVDEVISWLRQDIEYLIGENVADGGIEWIKSGKMSTDGFEHFDIVLIDGSEFLGKAELDHVIGARVIILDDTMAYKNYENRLRLLGDGRYVCTHDDKGLRNGFSVFQKI